MKRNATQHGAGTDKASTSSVTVQLLDLKARVIEARKGFIELGQGNDEYMSYVIAQATREGHPIDGNERKAIQQVMNLRVFTNDIPRVELIERALKFQQAA